MILIKDDIKLKSWKAYTIIARALVPNWALCVIML